MAFNICPIEVNTLIALELSDQDVVNFQLVCRSARCSVNDDSCYFWRLRFHATYDKAPSFYDGIALRKLYQIRRAWQKNAPRFWNGSSKREKKCLEVIKGLIIGAKPVKDEDHVPSSLNLEVLDHIIINTNLLDCIGETFTLPTRLLATIQLVLSSRCLRFIKDSHIYGFPTSQQAAYLSAAKSDGNLFADDALLEVNVHWALHLVNFFRYHMMRDAEATLFEPYKHLDKTSGGMDLPQFWKEQLTDADIGAPLGEHWKGTYAYLDRKDMKPIRECKERDIGTIQFEDRNIDLGGNAIQTLKLSFHDEAPFVWPSSFEPVLRATTYRNWARSPPMKTRAQHHARTPVTVPAVRNYRFEGVGYDDEDFYSTGVINPLPPQEGIPGWKRMTMMKYFLTDSNHFDEHALWAYEGVVLPGGQIIVGRWWSPENVAAENMYSGPFILWNTDCNGLKLTREATTAEFDSGILFGEV